jgi:hypothetical protein
MPNHVGSELLGAGAGDDPQTCGFNNAHIDGYLGIAYSLLDRSRAYHQRGIGVNQSSLDEKLTDSYYIFHTIFFEGGTSGPDRR